MKEPELQQILGKPWVLKLLGLSTLAAVFLPVVIMELRVRSESEFREAASQGMAEIEFGMKPDVDTRRTEGP